MKIFFATFFLLNMAWAMDVEVTDVVIKLPPSGLLNTAGLMTIKNNSNQDEELVKINSSISAVTELHRMKKENGYMKMRPVAGIVIPGRSTHDMKTTGYHVMFIKLTRPLKRGERFPLTLVFKSGEQKKITGSVE